jgi:hypothetical protein
MIPAFTGKCIFRFWTRSKYSNSFGSMAPDLVNSQKVVIPAQAGIQDG